ncbi:GlcG/HbpS family heme-binding protein [Novosphingobium mangrovi (ex Huang et al. 2023)]|uniref:Heme-binding protein n=1 Tax=Novosphingobium mangrovi (ex Huang et al. 2023) TaxID=2976432 RepID=A0ABT2I287_9SPHN|nr:heme-binding protein [Novosphingobium mangrovi (ex Huang et al. 2023)]MCT2398919.1 heme-binding protein [Novosphingobium mangrovi (ex Huang et al. 2023)]
MISLEQARAIVAATRAKGRDMGLNPLTVVILDAGGHLVAVEREDGSGYGRPDIAEGKAAGALAMGVSSRKLGDMAADRPQFMAALSAAWSGKLIPAAGGVLIRDGAGVLLGAVGVTGDLSDNDEEAALAGIEAAGLAAG